MALRVCGDWEVFFDDDQKREYYVNEVKGETVWVRPAEVPAADDDDESSADEDGVPSDLPPRMLSPVDLDSVVDRKSIATREESEESLVSSTPRSKVDANERDIKRGYVMMRLGAGLVHTWDVRFLSVSIVDSQKKNFFGFKKKPTDGPTEHNVCLTAKLDHSGNGMARRNCILIPGESTCMKFERDSYDLGRRKTLWGVRVGPKKDPMVFDVQDDETADSWLKELESVGIKSEGLVLATRANNNSLKEGWITKRGKVNTSWHRRYMVLMPNMLMYFTWKRDKKPAGMVPLLKTTTVIEDPEREATLIITPDPANKNERDRFGGRQFFITCHDEAEMHVWMNDIRAVTSKMN